MAKIARYSSRFIYYLSILMFMILTIGSFLGTCRMHPTKELDEGVLFLRDNLIMNLAVMSMVVIFIALILRKIEVTDKMIWYTAVGMILLSFIMGMVWLVNVRTIPQFDPGEIIRYADKSLNADYSDWKSKDFYLKKFPFQLGYMMFVETVFRVVGKDRYMVLEFMNLIMVLSSYIGIILLTRKVTDNNKITFLTIFLLGAFFQPILFSTYVYGNLIGMCCSIWAFYFYRRFEENKKVRDMLLTAIFISFGILMKKNVQLVEITLIVICILKYMAEKNRKELLLLAIIICMSMILSKTVENMYEKDAHEELGPGTPLTTHLAMGMQESERAPGWFNGYTFSIQKDNGYDYEAVREQNVQDIKDRAKIFLKEPDYAVTFFVKKIFSQWDEPSFQSVLVSQVIPHEGEIPEFVEEIYNGRASDVLFSYMKHYIQILYAMALLGIWINRKNINFQLLIPLLYLLGAFAYFLMFEGKSQYILVYIPFIIPYAAMGLESIAVPELFLKKRCDII